MRIIGGRDYYDGALSFGHDPARVFERPKGMTLSPDEASAIGLSAPLRPFCVDPLHEVHPRRRPVHWNGHRLNEACVVGTDTLHELMGAAVVFCGKLYTAAVVETWHESSVRGREHVFFWDWPSLQAWAKEMSVSIRPDGMVRADLAKPEDHFVRRALPSDVMARILEHRITIATRLPPALMEARRDVWGINGDRLGSMQFWKVLDPHAAFQELDMWVSGVLPDAGNSPVEITDDKVRIHKAGFDVRSSFRHRVPG